MSYSDIIDTYLAEESNIYNMISDIILEADGTNIKDSESNLASKLLEKVSTFIQKILDIIDNAILGLKNTFEKALLTDKGFQKELRNAEINRRPLNGIKVITYPYNDRFIDMVYKKIKDNVMGCINSFSEKYIEDENNPLNKSKEDMELFIYEKVGIPKEVDNTQAFFSYIKKEFRGNKSEITIPQSQLRNHISNVDNYSKIKNSINKDLIDMKNKMIGLKSKAKAISGMQDKTESERKHAIYQVSSLVFLINFFTSFTKFYFQLRVEEMLTSRIIIKRFYQL